ncbi:MarR family transcriptional regulator [Candidatus Woesearchaeota archaeon]|jgi:hypothetical protein|nr:MarR family transcriptional regulator [Candidatus Woesearchaeota archaeon]MBT4321841.1 MarR family transcriptional regulator [Candidatus Woesearchaeota archaeon]
MKNKNVGVLVIAISVILAIIIFTFNLSMKNIVAQTCNHGSSCTMYGTIVTQTNISLIVTGFILFIGLFLLFSKPEIKTIIKTQKKKRINTRGLNEEELNVVNLLKKEKAMFQRDLMEKLEIGKVKTTRLLDKLESKQIIERKRRGMNNIIVLKE